MDAERIPIHQMHDKFFKLAMRNIYIAREFFTTYLPDFLPQHINLGTLQLENTGFIDKHFKHKEADVIYSVKYNNDIDYCYFICEHQSTVVKRMALRFYTMQGRLMESHVKQHPEKLLPLVFPIVVYTGKARWNAPRDIIELLPQPWELARKLLHGKHFVLDVSCIPDEASLERPYFGLIEYVFKHRAKGTINKEFFAVFFPWLERVWKKLDSDTIQVVLEYVIDGIDGVDYTISMFEQQVEKYISSTTLKGAAMTLVQQYEQRGEQRGIEKGRQEAMILVQQYEQRGEQRGIEKGRQEAMALVQQYEQRGEQKGIHVVAKRLLAAGQKLDFIAKMTGLTVDEIRALQDKH